MPNGQACTWPCQPGFDRVKPDQQASESRGRQERRTGPVWGFVVGRHLRASASFSLLVLKSWQLRLKPRACLKVTGAGLVGLGRVRAEGARSPAQSCRPLSHTWFPCGSLKGRQGWGGGSRGVALGQPQAAPPPPRREISSSPAPAGALQGGFSRSSKCQPFIDNHRTKPSKASFCLGTEFIWAQEPGA